MKQQILFYVGLLLGAPLLPILYSQGRRVRAVVPRLPAAEGSEGTTGDGPRTLRLLVLGESTVAGVGVPHHRLGFAGRVAHFLAERSGKRVRWQALGRSGYTARQVRDELVPAIPREPLDLIVIGLGGNDTFRLRSPLRWRADMIGLIEALRRRQPGCPIVVANLPPIGDFPAFPRLMRVALGTLVRLHAAAIEDLPSMFPGLVYAARPVSLDAWVERRGGSVTLDDLFCDGVHPSTLTYDLWSEDLIELAWRGLDGLRDGGRLGVADS